ncbi:MAG: putative Ig domain-containing protein, partial [Verrucomicrobiota bacterium]
MDPGRKPGPRHLPHPRARHRQRRPAPGGRTFVLRHRRRGRQPATLAQPPLVTVLEGGSLSLTNSAADPDTPPSALRFSLDPGAPPAMRLDPVTGILTWTTTEDDGPGNYPVTVRVTEQDAGALSTSRTFSVRVVESNVAPTLDPLPDLDVWEGVRVAVVAAGRDSDRPAQVLSYSLDPGTPAGAGIDGVTGEFTWNIPPDLGASTNVITVRVTDSGPGNLSATQSFRILTRPVLNVVFNEIMYRPAAAGAR